MVVGDLPSAYLVVEAQDSPAEALERYCVLIEDWIAAVRDSDNLRDVFPYRQNQRLKTRESLEKRIAFLLAEIIPRMIR